MKMNFSDTKLPMKTAILVKDKDWSKKLAKFSAMLPALAETASRWMQNIKKRCPEPILI